MCVHPQDDHGLTPLALALITGRPKVAARLASRGADASAADNQGVAPVHRAAGHGDLKALDLLKESGADFEAQSGAGTPLHWAAGEVRFHEANCCFVGQMFYEGIGRYPSSCCYSGDKSLEKYIVVNIDMRSLPRTLRRASSFVDIRHLGEMHHILEFLINFHLHPLVMSEDDAPNVVGHIGATLTRILETSTPPRAWPVSKLPGTRRIRPQALVLRREA